jgi:hypothetical protein
MREHQLTAFVGLGKWKKARAAQRSSRHPTAAPTANVINHKRMEGRRKAKEIIDAT